MVLNAAFFWLVAAIVGREKSSACATSLRRLSTEIRSAPSRNPTSLNDSEAEAGAPYKGSKIRKCFTGRFPFAMFYKELADMIWIVAIAHGRRQPDYRRIRRPDSND